MFADKVHDNSLTYFYLVSDAAGNAAAPRARQIFFEDTTPPVLTLTGDAILDVEAHPDAAPPYVDPGCTATDSVDPAPTVTLIFNNVQPNVLGDYTVTYSGKDTSNNIATGVSRTVRVRDTTAPNVTLVGSASMEVNAGDTFVDPGATAVDSFEGPLNVTVTGNVVTDLAATFQLTYTARDSSGNIGTATRIVSVVDKLAPVVTLRGSSAMTWEAATAFIDPGATSVDNLDGNITAMIQRSPGVVNVNRPNGTVIVLTYTSRDDAGNIGSAVRTVTLVDTTPPTLTLLGSATLEWEAAEAFVEPGYTASDTLDGNLTASVVLDPVMVDTLQADGTETDRTYTVADVAGNTVSTSRTIVLRDRTPPAMDLEGSEVVMHEAATPFDDPGCTAVDTLDGDCTASIVRTPAVVNTVQPNGTTITLDYRVTDAAGNEAAISRTVILVDTTPPDMHLVGDDVVVHEAATPFDDPGCTAVDTLDGDCTMSILRTPAVVNTVQPNGTVILLEYTATDLTGNKGHILRTMILIDTTPPIIELVGDAVLAHEAGTPFVDPGCTAVDRVDGDCTSRIVRTPATVDTSPLDENSTSEFLQLEYRVADRAGNTANISRTLILVPADRNQLCTPSSNGGGTGDSDSSGTSNKSSSGASAAGPIAGGVAAGLVLCAVVIVGILYGRRRQKSNNAVLPLERGIGVTLANPVFRRGATSNPADAYESTQPVSVPDYSEISPPDYVEPTAPRLHDNQATAPYVALAPGHSQYASAGPQITGAPAGYATLSPDHSQYATATAAPAYGDYAALVADHKGYSVLPAAGESDTDGVEQPAASSNRGAHRYQTVRLQSRNDGNLTCMYAPVVNIKDAG